jgi:formylglycine-generating enzyme required for sulfatase activity
VDIADPEHPIVKGMKPFETNDELYTSFDGDKPIHVLATATSKVDGQAYPMAFVHQYGKGRVFFCALGHDVNALSVEAVQSLYRRGTAWAAGLAPVARSAEAPRPAGTDASPGVAAPPISRIGAPPPAVAPFDATKAKEHQEAWAKYLGVPVEVTNSIGMKLVPIPPGEFDMGSTPEEITAEIEGAKKGMALQGLLDRVSAEGPRHHVKISGPFFLGIYQVTQADYEKVLGVNPSAFTTRQMDLPEFEPPFEQKKKERWAVAGRVAGKDTSRHAVETVSWDDCVEFCRRLSAMPAERAAGRVYRLPSEAEWEYACRAGTTTRWHAGDDEAGLADVAWFTTNAGGMTHPVGQKRPNAWGLYDMHGNVFQWCADWFGADYYKQSPPNDPSGPPAGSNRVVRGGDWLYGPSYCRSSIVPAWKMATFAWGSLPACAGVNMKMRTLPDDFNCGFQQAAALGSFE